MDLEWSGQLAVGVCVRESVCARWEGLEGYPAYRSIAKMRGGKDNTIEMKVWRTEVMMTED